MTLQILTFIGVIILAAGGSIFFRSLQVPSRVRKAEELFEQGDDSRAGDIVRKVLEKKKDFVPARYLRARMLIKQTQYLLAISELNGILNTPDFSRHVPEVDIHYKLAELYNQTQQWNKEIDEYRMILSFNPNDTNANHRVGHSFYRQKRYREARETLGRAIGANPNLHDSYLPLGVCCFQLNEYDSAEQYLLKAVDSVRPPAEGYFHLGLIYKGKRDYDNAIRMFQNAKKENRFFRESLYRIGEICFETDQYEEGIKVLEEGLGTLKPREEESIAYRYLLAECYEMENKIAEAVHHWEKIQQESPNYRSTQIKLEDYKAILENDNLRMLFSASLEELQTLINEIIARLNYNVLSRNDVSPNQIYYKALNIKRINEPAVLIYFNRTTHEITEGQVNDFDRLIKKEKCKNGIYITTAKFSLKARTACATKQIDMVDKEKLAKTIARIKGN